MPQEVKVDTRRTYNFTNLSWKAPMSGNVKGYICDDERDHQCFLAKEKYLRRILNWIFLIQRTIFLAVQLSVLMGMKGWLLVPVPASR
jgi:hypothetical protein